MNFGRKTVSGVDTQIDWRIPAGVGSLALNAVVSWLDRFGLEPQHGLASEELTGTVGSGIGGAQPEWKGHLLVACEGSTASVGLKWRYLDAMRDADPRGQGSTTASARWTTWTCSPRRRSSPGS